MSISPGVTFPLLPSILACWLSWPLMAHQEKNVGMMAPYSKWGIEDPTISPLTRAQGQAT